MSRQKITENHTSYIKNLRVNEIEATVESRRKKQDRRSYFKKEKEKKMKKLKTTDKGKN